MRYLVLHGPNLNLLGTRRPDVYGDETLADVDELCRLWASELGDTMDSYQSNHEGNLIERIHRARERVDGIVFNPGAFTHTSYALHDALEAVEIPTVEVHISNVLEREPWRRTSRIRPACVHTIYGRGVEGYRWALRHLHHHLESPPTTLPYGSGPDHVGDLRLPAGEGPHPLTVLLHGGFWKHQWTRDTVDGIAADLTARGVATWVPEYRRVGTGGGGSATFADVARAIDHVVELPGHLDLDRLCLVGHSAGGHLALWAAARADAAVTPALVVGLAPVSDLAAASEHGLGDGAVAAFLGAGPHDDLDPRSRLPLGVPQSIVHGAADSSVPVAMSDDYVADAEAAGDEVDYHRLEGVGHLELVNPASPAWAVARRAILDATAAD
ncbi:MAG: type II 3-dehydroquinate dehydratase [Acidimicrobiia bacterium]